MSSIELDERVRHPSCVDLDTRVCKISYVGESESVRQLSCVRWMREFLKIVWLMRGKFRL